MKVKRIIPKAEATKVFRNPKGPWEWPRVAQLMTNDCYKVTQETGLTAVNGDPLPLAYAVNFLDRLYKLGYAVVELEK